MQIFDIQSSDMVIKVTKISTGETIRFETNITWIDDSNIDINCTDSDKLEGGKKELYRIDFNRSNFKSKAGASLRTEYLETNPNYFAGLSPALDKMKNTVSTTVKSTIIAVFAINSLTGSSGEMMFSFVNNL